LHRNSQNGRSSSILPEIGVQNNAKVAAAFGDITFEYLNGILKEQKESSPTKKQAKFQKAGSFEDVQEKDYFKDETQSPLIVDTMTI